MKTTANSKKIKDLRERKGWSQDQLAELSRLSLRTIQRVEKDGKSSIESIKSLASVFELDFKELLEDKLSKQYTDIEFLTRFQFGKQVVDIIGGKHGYDFDFETSIVETTHLELIHSFFQQLQDYNDFWDEIEYVERGQAIQFFQNKIEELERNGLWVFGGETRRPVGEYTPPLIFDILVMRVYTKDNAMIIKIDLGEVLVGESKNSKGFDQ
jgi:transcriptional regulator with XRE-family HTH domain